ncbi:MAG: hypothetical protein V3T86_12300 [Planctomycetota bacterium]
MLPEPFPPLDREQFQRVSEIFAEVLEKRIALEDQKDFVRERVGDDDAVARDVLAMLRLHRLEEDCSSLEDSAKDAVWLEIKALGAMLNRGIVEPGSEDAPSA